LPALISNGRRKSGTCSGVPKEIFAYEAVRARYCLRWVDKKTKTAIAGGGLKGRFIPPKF